MLKTSPRLLHWSAVAVAYAVGIVASVTGGCVTVYDGDFTCEVDCDPPEGECPVAEPNAEDFCDQDGLTCSYSHEPDEECTYKFRCDPVYPEAGAPSEWVFVDTVGGGCEQCLEAPACAEFEEQVESCDGIEGVDVDCHSVSACGSTIFCVGSTCDLAPSCDPDDAPAVNGCEVPNGCYTVEVCGSSLVCADISLPQHGCPITEPNLGDPCTDELICDYPDGECFSSYGCSDGVWMGVGGGCDL